MLIGYMRVSSDNDRQTTDLQRAALIQAGVDARHLFEDKASGARDDRTGLAQALEYVRSGDCLVVWKLDRLGRSLSHLIHIVTDLPSAEPLESNAAHCMMPWQDKSQNPTTEVFF